MGSAPVRPRPESGLTSQHPRRERGQLLSLTCYQRHLTLHKKKCNFFIKNGSLRVARKYLHSSFAAKTRFSITSPSSRLNSTPHAQGASGNHLPSPAKRPGSTRRTSAGSGRHPRPCLSGRAAALPLPACHWRSC